ARKTLRRDELPSPRIASSRQGGSGSGGLRWQPPVHSPVTPLAVAGSMFASLTGPDRDIEQLSRLLSSRYAADRVLLRGSGTQALRQAIELVTAAPDAIVAIPAFGCYDLATAAIGSGRQVVL